MRIVVVGASGNVGTAVPRVMDTGKARGPGWAPTRPADAVLRDFLAALAAGRGNGSRALAPRKPASGRRAAG